MRDREKGCCVEVRVLDRMRKREWKVDKEKNGKERKKQRQ
jgi:hypothetical protein